MMMLEGKEPTAKRAAAVEPEAAAGDDGPRQLVPHAADADDEDEDESSGSDSDDDSDDEVRDLYSTYQNDQITMFCEREE